MGVDWARLDDMHIMVRFTMMVDTRLRMQAGHGRRIYTLPFIHLLHPGGVYVATYI